MDFAILQTANTGSGGSKGSCSSKPIFKDTEGVYNLVDACLNMEISKYEVSRGHFTNSSSNWKWEILMNFLTLGLEISSIIFSEVKVVDEGSRRNWSSSRDGEKEVESKRLFGYL